MRMKKAITLFLLAALALATGCAPAQTPEPPAPTAAQTAPAETPAPADAQALTVAFTPLDAGTPYAFDVDGDGAAETLLLTEEQDDDAAFGTAVYLTVTKDGIEQITKMADAYFFCAYYMEAEGKTGLAITGTYENDYMCTGIFLFEGASVRELSQEDGGILTAENGELVIMSRLYALGTWSVEIACEMTTDFKLLPVADKEWTILGCEHPLTVKKELPIETENDACAYVTEYLSVGTKLWLISGDGQSYVRFSLEDGRMGKLSYKVVDGMATLVDGTPDTDWLDDIVYAG
ncbi:MAG: hypothetical protein ABFC62_03250 [Clostridiaceae bacterium]|nr:hypothetical protein [Eubacteriales bacterium]